MKLIVQIPCYNEASTLPLLFQDMPRSLPGIDCLEFLVIDDGSTDETIRVAQTLGVHHILRIPGRNRRWLGRAFKQGIDYCLHAGADIVVNTDGDNQYSSAEIPALIAPLLSGECDLVIADRNPGSFSEFSKTKRFLQRLGNSFIQLLTREECRDACSGFRAYTREALLRIHVMTNFTYTVDSLIQAQKKGLDIQWMPIRPNAKTRESRLIRSPWEKTQRSGFNALRLFAVYDSFRAFTGLALLFFIPGLFLLARFAWIFFFVHEHASGHVQSVVVGSACIIISALLFVVGVLSGLLSVNRSLLEEILTRVRRLESKDSALSSHSEPSKISANR